MASLEPTTPAVSHEGLISRLGDFFVNWFEVVGKEKSREKEFEYFASLTDEQLAAKGLSRNEIARHVFRDLYYI